MGWWVADLYHTNPAALISWVVWVIVSITLHELAHGIAAIWCGDRTPIETGHMTWNPIVHMSPQSLIIFAVIGIAWGAMPVNPSRFRKKYDDALVSFAGPALNIALAIICVVAGALWIRLGGFASVTLQSNLELFFRMGAGLNIVLALFNLLPIPPLDGSRILASFSWRFREFMYKPESAVIALIAIVVIFVGGGGGIIFGFGFNIANQAIGAVVTALGG
jgi:Zn-dependent protease